MTQTKSPRSKGEYLSSRSHNRRERMRRIMKSPLFEPLVAVAVILLIVTSLFAYTGTWPPMVVIESQSMQHGYNDVPGIINTGDIVLVKHEVNTQDLTTYVEGEVNGFSTYGEYGNVLLYIPHDALGDVLSTTPVIHRAIVYLQYDGASGYSFPSVFALNCPTQYVVINPVGVRTCPTYPSEPELGQLVLYGVGWQGVTVDINLNALIQQRETYSGYITMGDNNINYGSNPASGEYDQQGGCLISCLVQPSWIEGVARGMIPWFGALKLWLEGNSGEVPSQTWVYLAVSILAIIAIPQVLPWTYRRLRDKLQSRHGGRDSEDEEASPPDSRPPKTGPP